MKYTLHVFVKDLKTGEITDNRKEEYEDIEEAKDEADYEIRDIFDPGDDNSMRGCFGTHYERATLGHMEEGGYVYAEGVAFWCGDEPGEIYAKVWVTDERNVIVCDYMVSASVVD